MKLIEAKTNLERHIAPQSSIVLISGKWGVGKSFLIHEFLEEKRKLKDKNDYIRISVFNTESIKDFRSKLGLSYLLKFTPEGKFRKLIAPIFGVISNIPKIRNLTGSFGDKISDTAYYLISGTTIWIDDLERASTQNVSISILGEIIDIVENQKCKAIVACNLEKMTSDDALRHSLEKVCTTHFEFNRDFDEILSFGLGEYASEPSIKHIAEKLEIRNIRIFSRIKRALDVLLKPYENLDSNVKNQIVATSALACFVKYGENNTLSNYAQLYTHGKIIEKEEKAKAQESFLYTLGYSETDELDKAILLYVEKGILNEPEYRLAVVNNTNQSNQSALRHEYNVLREAIFEDFSLENTEAFEKILSFVEKFRELMDVYYWDRIIGCTSRFSDPDKISQLLALAPEHFTIGFKGKEERAFGRERPNFHPLLVERIEWIEEDKDESDIERIFDRLISANGWWSEDYQKLAGLDPIWLSEYLLSSAKLKGGPIFNRLIELGESSTSVDNHIEIGKAAIKAFDLMKASPKGCLAMSIFEPRVEKLKQKCASR